jgi:hypothetical protein
MSHDDKNDSQNAPATPEQYEFMIILHTDKSSNILPHRNDGTHGAELESVKMFNLLRVTMVHWEAIKQNCITHVLGADRFCLHEVSMEYLANMRAQHFNL